MRQKYSFSISYSTLFKVIILRTSTGKSSCSEQYYEEAVLPGIQYSPPETDSTHSFCEILLLGKSVNYLFFLIISFRLTD